MPTRGREIAAQFLTLPRKVMGHLCMDGIGAVADTIANLG